MAVCIYKENEYKENENYYIYDIDSAIVGMTVIPFVNGSAYVCLYINLYIYRK